MVNYGLTAEEVQKSRAENGSNGLTEQAREGFWAKFASNLKDPMMIILLVALIINVIFTILGKTEWYESVGIAAAILIATLVSTFSEYKNENAFQKLQEEAAQITCKVWRDGEIIEVSINEIVTGDAVVLQAGDKVPADGSLLSGSIKVEQSALNGEPAEVAKYPLTPEQMKGEFDTDTHNDNSVFRGSVVASGNAVMHVRLVGDKTMIGGIAKEVQEDDGRQTPLQVKLSGLAKGISKFGYIGGGLIAVALLFQRIFIDNGFNGAEISAYFTDFGNFFKDFLDAVMLAVIIIVMAVPEGLPLMISIVSSLNMGKMLKDNVLVRKISGIETAGSLNLLFSDKTGTITKGHLEVVLFSDGLGLESPSFTEIPQPMRSKLGLCINENTDSVVSGGKIIGGNLTERAVLAFTQGVETIGAKKLAAIPFNSDNKYSASFIETADFKGTVIKGAPERLLPRCKHFFGSKGEKLPIDDNWIINKKIDELADRAIRVLAFAISNDPITDNEHGEPVIPEKNWTFVGIVGIRDEVRPESVTAMKEVMDAGVQVVMITGDRKETAVAIAKDAGLVTQPTDVVWTSDEFNQLDDETVKQNLPNLRVIARALPHDKSRLVRIAQSINLVVGMTGDGVNDSPALKAADIGFAMGSGTEVAKEASEIIIMDDNFNSIDKAILYGRTIFNNIRKFIVFQLTINVSAVLISFIAPFIGFHEPLTITQILWINLIMDTLAAIAFGGEPALHRYMREKPKRRDEPILSKAMMSEIAVGGLLILTLAIVYLKVPFVTNIFAQNTNVLSGTHTVTQHLMTGFFGFFVFAAVFNAFNARTDRINLFENITLNKGFLRVIGLIVVIQAGLLYLGGAIFNCFGLTLPEWLVVLGFAIVIIPVDLLRKVLTRQKKYSK